MYTFVYVQITFREFRTNPPFVRLFLFFFSLRAFGWAGLLDEVEMDIKRLARRNLGRDDR